MQDSLFSQAYIPKHLDDVDDHEADFQRLAVGGAAAEGIYYQAPPPLTATPCFSSFPFIFTTSLSSLRHCGYKARDEPAAPGRLSWS